MLMLRKMHFTFISDFISLELERGTPRLLIDFGSGTLELRVKTKKSLDDGEWHRIDVFWDTEVRIIGEQKYCKNKAYLVKIC
jgi:hypothetical protein